MKRGWVCIALALSCLPLRAENEIGFIESFSLAPDREEALKQLIPGTRDYYYYHCLHYQNLGDRERFDEYLEPFVKRHGHTGRVKELLNRQALIDYETDPERSLEFIRKELGVQFNHRRKLEHEPSSAPNRLDPERVSYDSFASDALGRYKDLRGFEDAALERLAGDDLNDIRRRHLLGRLQRPDIPNLVDLVVADLRARDSRGFGSHGIHANMLPNQLVELAKQMPELKNTPNFVNAILSKLTPNPDLDIKVDDQAREAYLDRLWNYVENLDPVHNSLKVRVLHRRLEHDRAKGLYDPDRFMTYIKLPRNVSYINRDYLNDQNQRHRVNLGGSRNAQDPMQLPPVANDEPVVMDYLAHFLVDADTYKPYLPYIREEVLKRVMAETKILNEIGDPERWASMLTPSEYKALKDRVELDFVPSNPTYFDPEDPVSLDLNVKNVTDLIVKVFEINTVNYYREKQEQINLAVNLDGLVATFEERKALEDLPLVRARRTFEFPQLEKRGVYVVEFIGNGKSSRALVQKGRLHFLEKVTSAGHAFIVLDEDSVLVKDASLWIAGRSYEPDENGEILVPFTARPGQETVVVRQGDFASLGLFRHHAETYALNAGFHVDRESLIKGNKATVLVSSTLTVSDMPCSLELLEDVKLTIESVDRDGISSRKEMPDFKLRSNGEATYEFKVPDNLSAIAFSLEAKVQNVSANRKDTLGASKRFTLNQMDGGAYVYSFHVAHADGRYILEALGKNGEARPGMAFSAEFKHRLIKVTRTIPLQTDADGRCDLGALSDIDWFRVNAQDGTSYSWTPARTRMASPSAINAVVGDVVRVPMPTFRLEDPSEQISLLERNQGYIKDWKSACVFRNGFLEIEGLHAGDYILRIKPERRDVFIRVTAGRKAYGYALSKTRCLQLPHLNPVTIGGVEPDEDEIRVSLVGASPFARVHVLATRYLPEYDAYRDLGLLNFPGLMQKTRMPIESLYESGRKIGDEYRYILNRKSAKIFPGNMLERPGLLLNPWAIRQTDAGRESLAETGRYGGSAAGMGAPAEEEPQSLMQRGLGVRGHVNLDFLAEPSVLLANLQPDENGLVRIDRDSLGPHACVRILVRDVDGVLEHTLALDDAPLETSELRLVLGLDPEKQYAEQKLITPVTVGDTFTIEDVSTSEMETYDSLPRVYKLYMTLSGNGTLAEFEFVVRWPELDDAEKQKLYSEYACHELNFFLFQKDPDFFKAVILPYLENKKDKTFMDHWLIEAPLDAYLEPWAFGRLNIVERILLGRRIREQHPALARHVRELWELIPPDVEAYIRRFDTAIQSSALDEDGEFEEKKSVAISERIDALASMEMLVQKAEIDSLYVLDAKVAKKKSSSRMKETEEVLEKRLGDLADEANSELRPREAPGVVSNTASFGDDNGAVAAGALVNGRKSNREQMRQLFRKLDETEELVENNYYKLPIEQQGAGLVTVNGFWRDYAAYHGGEPFLTEHLAEPTRNFTEMMLALAVIDLPFVAEEHETSSRDAAFAITPASPMVVFHEEIMESEMANDPTPILVSQHFFRPDDRYRHVNNEQFEKYVTEEFLHRIVYGCQVILTNPNANRQKLSLLLQIPRGAVPVSGGFYTKGRPVTLEPYATQTMEYYFYFPETGMYPHYPVNVAKNEQLVGHADPFLFNVVERLSKVDTTSWAYVSQHGTDEEVIDFLRENNLHRFDLSEIAWRMKEKLFFSKVIILLDQRHRYDHTLWSYALYHDAPALRSYLAHSPFADRVGEYIETPLLTVDPVARNRYQHMEYAPLVNPRAHQVGRERSILNHRFLGQYQRLMTVLSYKPELDDADELAVTYYLLLQDRVEDGLAWFDRVDPGALPTRLQYDYTRAYVSIYEENLDRARTLAETYADYPVPKWQSRFVNVLNQLKEIDQGVDEVADPENREQEMSRLAATEPSLDFKVENKRIGIRYENLPACRVNYYPMDIELLFSRNPFIQDQSAQFSLIRPVLSQDVALPEGEKNHAFPLPEQFKNSNVMIEVVAGGLRSSQAYYANAMSAMVIENYGQVKVSHETTGEPLSKVYVKVYGKLNDGRVKFFKDGYTDFRGRFDYVSLNTNEIDKTDRLALLILSEEHGAMIREARPPKR